MGGAVVLLVAAVVGLFWPAPVHDFIRRTIKPK
jgi:hypothetical protein